MYVNNSKYQNPLNLVGIYTTSVYTACHLNPGEK